MSDSLLLWVICGLLLWFVIGCAVLVAMDDLDQSLFKWASSAPCGLYVPTVMAWPVLVYLLLRKTP